MTNVWTGCGPTARPTPFSTPASGSRDLLHLTLHQPTRQPLDTLYNLRMEQGRQTVVTLMFVREAFGYGEPVFRQDVMDGFMADKLEARRTV